MRRILGANTSTHVASTDNGLGVPPPRPFSPASGESRRHLTRAASSDMHTTYTPGAASRRDSRMVSTRSSQFACTACVPFGVLSTQSDTLPAQQSFLDTDFRCILSHAAKAQGATNEGFTQRLSGGSCRRHVATAQRYPMNSEHNSPIVVL